MSSYSLATTLLGARCASGFASAGHTTIRDRPHFRFYATHSRHKYQCYDRQIAPQAVRMPRSPNGGIEAFLTERGGWMVGGTLRLACYPSILPARLLRSISLMS